MVGLCPNFVHHLGPTLVPQTPPWALSFPSREGPNLVPPFLSKSHQATRPKVDSHQTLARTEARHDHAEDHSLLDPPLSRAC
jgi:hypothetical protein